MIQIYAALLDQGPALPGVEAVDQRSARCWSSIDKIVDLRRGMIDDRNVPPSLQEPLKALESRGNPYGKMASKLLERRLSPA